MHNLVQTSHIKMSHPFENFLPISAKSSVSSSSSSLGQKKYYSLKFSINVMTIRVKMAEDDSWCKFRKMVTMMRMVMRMMVMRMVMMRMAMMRMIRMMVMRMVVMRLVMMRMMRMVKVNG